MRHATGRTSPHLVSRQAGVSHLSVIVSLAASEARLLGLHRERLSYGASGVGIELTPQALLWPRLSDSGGRRP